MIHYFGGDHPGHRLVFIGHDPDDVAFDVGIAHTPGKPGWVLSVTVLWWSFGCGRRQP